MNNRILIVDDSASWRFFHQDIIKQLYGNIFEIVTADSANEGLSVIKENKSNPFCLIITDLQMELDFEPQLAGEWLVENIKELSEYSTSHIVIVSGMYNIEHIAQKYNVECISKPMLSRNKLLLKFMFEKLMPFLTKL